jgi:hypothetical protein
MIYNSLVVVFGGSTRAETPVFDGRISNSRPDVAPLSLSLWSLVNICDTSDGDIQVSTVNLHNMISRIIGFSVRDSPGPGVLM